MTKSTNIKSIALVANSTWNIYNFRQNLIDRFIKEGYEVFVIAPVDEYISYREKYSEVRHFNLRMMDRDGTNPFRDILLVLEMIRRYRKLSPDVVLHFTNKPNIYGGIAAKIAGVKSIAVVTGLGHAFINNGLTKSIMEWLYRQTGMLHEKFIFENADDRALFIQLKIISESKSISVKGCGVDTEYFKQSTTPKSAENIIFTFIGRLLYDKGIKEFVSAARIIKAKHPEVQFWVVGELDDDNPSTVDRDELVRWIDQDTIIYQGFHKDIRPIINESNCIVLPSYREGLPRTILEAMSMSRPVITTDTAGCRETVDEGLNGYLVPIKDVDALAVAIQKIIDLTPEERTNMGIQGREKVLKEFNDQLIADNIFNIVQKAITN